jgi:tetratricopeptide (TPR) repeat protein
VKELESLAEMVSPEGNSDNWASLHMALCRCHRERGDFAAAIEVGERGLEMLAKAQDRWLESGVMLGATLLSVFCEQGDLVHARHFADRLVQYAEEVGSVRARAAAYWEAGIAADFRGEVEHALRLEERAMALLGESDDARNIARLRDECGRLLLRAGPEQAGRARDLLLAAREELAATSAGSIDYARCLTTIARAEIALGRHAEAIELAREAMGIAGGAPRLVSAEALIVLGQSYVRLGRHDEALPILKDAAKQLEDMRATRHAAQAWFEVAELLGELGDYTGRAHAYRKACACVGLR